MTIGLQYEPETEKLTLQIIRANLSQSSLKQNQGIGNLKYAHVTIERNNIRVTYVNRVILLSYCCIILLACYYGKVTLFEGASVVKAKKTRPVPALLHEISVPISPFKGTKNDSDRKSVV